MRINIIYLIFLCMSVMSCSHDGYRKSADINNGIVNVLFLHHSTGQNIYRGLYKDGKSAIDEWFLDYNQNARVKINFVDKIFPKQKRWKFFKGYGWNNYPFDYYNIWVKNGMKKSYKNEPTLESLVPIWDVIVFKHCFPVSNIVEGEKVDINSDIKTLVNYKLQYNALKKKMHEYPNTKFVVWTGAVQTRLNSTEEEALRTKEFFDWVKNEWDESNDNIFIWDYYELETEGGLYFKNEYAVSPEDSHPNENFSDKVSKLFCSRLVDVINNNGELTTLTGHTKGEKLIEN